MKKSILAVILMIGAFFCAFGQNSGPIDLVLLLDTSSVMGFSYERVNDYITGAFLSEFLRTGDTFHLITFSASPRLDIARRVSERGDIETIIGRMLIQYPVETGNDASAAVNYVEAYISTLPPRPKKIVMVSAGGSDTNNIVSAAKQRLGSKNATLDFVSVTGGQPLANLPSSGRPASGQASPSRQTPSQQRPSSGTTSTGTVSATPPAGAASSTSATQVTSQTGAQATAQGTSQTGAQSTMQSTSQTSVQPTTQPSAAPPDSSAVSASSTPSSAQGVSPSGSDKGTAEQNYDFSGQNAKAASKRQEGSPTSFNPKLLLVTGIIAAILLLILLIFFVSRRLGSSPNRIMASVSALSQKKEKRFTDYGKDLANYTASQNKKQVTPHSDKPVKENRFTDHSKDLANYAASQNKKQITYSDKPVKENRFTDHSKDLANYAASQNKKRVTPYSNKPIKEQAVKQPEINPTDPLLINLFVEDQNTSIGKRNIHLLKSGYSLSVGGGKSDDFLIFLVPMPSNLGEIRRNGSQLTFTPHKPKYFPDIGSNEVKDCINKRIRVVSEKNYEMWFSFVIYQDPLIALNRVLQSVKVPGL